MCVQTSEKTIQFYLYRGSMYNVCCLYSAPPTVIIVHKAVVVLSVFLFVHSLLTLNAIDENVVLKNKIVLLLLLLCGLKLFNLNLCSLYIKHYDTVQSCFKTRLLNGCGPRLNFFKSTYWNIFYKMVFLLKMLYRK